MKNTPTPRRRCDVEDEEDERHEFLIDCIGDWRRSRREVAGVTGQIETYCRPTAMRTSNVYGTTSTQDPGGGARNRELLRSVHLAACENVPRCIRARLRDVLRSRDQDRWRDEYRLPAELNRPHLQSPQRR